MNRCDWMILGYSVLLLIGGLSGYLMAGSVLSLMMSSLFAILLICALFIGKSYPLIGTRLIYTLIFLLFLFFTIRWMLTQKFFPSGMFGLISFAVLTLIYFLPNCKPKNS